MIAVVTGSTGFIGSHLVDALLARGATVRALVRPETRAAVRDPRIEHWEADLLDDRSVRSSLVWEGATQVYHLAGVTKGRTSGHFRSGNVVPTANVLAAIAARSGTLPRIVLVSSQAAAGPAPSPESPVRESDRPMPVEAYGRSKLEAEQAVLRYQDQLSVTIVRPCAVYGPRDRDFLAAFRQAARPLSFHAAPREQRFSLLHVDDVIQALLRAAERPSAVGRTYFLAGDRDVTWRELYDTVARAAARRTRQLQVPRFALGLAAHGADAWGALSGQRTLLNRNKVKLASAKWWIADAARARAELDWCPTVSLDEGVRATYAWYVEQGWMKAIPAPIAAESHAASRLSSAERPA